MEIFRAMMARGGESGMPLFVGRLGAVGLARPLLYLGKADEELQLVKSFLPFPGLVAVCLAHLGRENEVTEILEKLVATYPSVGTQKDESVAWDPVSVLEAAVMVKNKKIAALLLDRLGDNTLATTGIGWLTCPARHYGAAAALLGRADEARKHYSRAIKVATDMRFRPELALTRLQLAELLLEHYPKERAEALEHLDFAIKEFREMKMQPSLERALRHKEILKA
ncbi:hypothetical protein FDZ71_06525 [bacterium]|nr:MAG: hypothetical protein FDZ71_06525 [bacterium]